jgi:hypothetical protein
MKTKRFGRIFAFTYSELNDSKTMKPKPGLSIQLDKDVDVRDEFDGEWIRLGEAKRLYKSLGAAIKYIEKELK